MSESDRLAADEIERSIMIRKSLASRTSSMGARNSQDSGLPNYHQLEEFDREEREEREATASRNESINWKDLEAGTQRQEFIPGIQNMEMGIHPALLQPQLAFPAPSRAPSPSRGLQPPRLAIPV
ncbi:hypothetical protein F4776DRAFT_662088 [Hypoxylon sp. NC0597]|nr:hypothetical protein F4776DRAFT_662088 [Hypoxylon sp. NC0597]